MVDLSNTSKAVRQRIGFVGVGFMGHGMASRLLQAGYELTVIAHSNRSNVDDLLARGGHEAENYTALAEASDTVILCVTDSKAVAEVVAAMKPGLRAGMTVIDTGTSSPVSTREVWKELDAIGVEFVESPLTGGVKQAAAGELGALVGASDETFERVTPLLETFCKTVHHFGPPGAGNTAKLLNNYMVLGIAALVTDAFSKADEANVDWQKLYDVVICGSADSGVLRRIIGSAVNGDFKGYVFNVDSSLKDIRYLCEMLESTESMSPLAAAVRNVYEDAVGAGHGKRLLSELLAPEVRATQQVNP